MELNLLERRKKELQDLLEEFPQIQLWIDAKKTAQQMVEIKSWFRQHVNPAGEVPVVDIDGKIVPESEISSEFVDASFPGHGTNLMPTDPYKVAKVRIGMKIFGSNIPNFYALITNQEPEKDAEIGDKLHQACEQFFRHFSPASEGPYFLGKDFSLADIFAIPFFYRFILALKYYRGFSLIPGPELDSKFTWAARARTWWAAVCERESFMKSTLPEKNLIALYEGYANKQILTEAGNWAGRGISNTFA